MAANQITSLFALHALVGFQVGSAIPTESLGVAYASYLRAREKDQANIGKALAAAFTSGRSMAKTHMDFLRGVMRTANEQFGFAATAGSAVGLGLSAMMYGLPLYGLYQGVRSARRGNWLKAGLHFGLAAVPLFMTGWRAYQIAGRVRKEPYYEPERYIESVWEDLEAAYLSSLRQIGATPRRGE